MYKQTNNISQILFILKITVTIYCTTSVKGGLIDMKSGQSKVD